MILLNFKDDRRSAKFVEITYFSGAANAWHLSYEPGENISALPPGSPFRRSRLWIFTSLLWVTQVILNNLFSLLSIGEIPTHALEGHDPG